MVQNEFEKYEDMLGLPHPVSKRHPPLSAGQRAAQFSPFAALSGYGAAISETGRLTEEKIETDDSEMLRLGERLNRLAEAADRHPQAELCYFVKDARKEGGAYRNCSGTVKKVDGTAGILRLEDGTAIAFEDILSIESPLFAEQEREEEEKNASGNAF